MFLLLLPPRNVLVVRHLVKTFNFHGGNKAARLNSQSCKSTRWSKQTAFGAPANSAPVQEFALWQCQLWRGGAGDARTLSGASAVRHTQVGVVVTRTVYEANHFNHESSLGQFAEVTKMRPQLRHVSDCHRTLCGGLRNFTNSFKSQSNFC